MGSSVQEVLFICRILGRVIGLSVIIPGIYFASRGYMSSRIKMKSLVIAVMVGFQGILGWYMVKSGLGEEVLQKRIPRVNHYWLSAHLGNAFLIYSAMVLTGLEILDQQKKHLTVILKLKTEKPSIFKNSRRVDYAACFRDGYNRSMGCRPRCRFNLQRVSVDG